MINRIKENLKSPQKKFALLEFRIAVLSNQTEDLSDDLDRSATSPRGKVAWQGFVTQLKITLLVFYELPAFLRVQIQRIWPKKRNGSWILKCFCYCFCRAFHRAPQVNLEPAIDTYEFFLFCFKVARIQFHFKVWSQLKGLGTLDRIRTTE